MQKIIVIACEGVTEKRLIDFLLDANLLKVKREDLLDDSVYEARSPSVVAHIIATIKDEVEIYYLRIGDTLKDKLNFRCLTLKQNFIHEYRICTKPEIEILAIIALDKVKDFNKSNLNPKAFIRSLGIYDFNDFILKYDVCDLLKEYKRIKRNNKDEYYLADLLKD